jgi:nitroimidazol reductase NimA-like FMN-containing flavoprotein (pyridoxamine 5'-phosphate oxidase superfamily)
MTSANDPIQALDEAQSWQFLSEHRIGRLAVVIGGEPDIFPVNYVVDDRSIVFRTAEGSKLLAVSLGGRMAFQVDEWDHTGAVSVLAHGTAREMSAEEAAEAETLGLTPWVATLKVHWVRLEVDEIAGRAFTFGPEPESFHPVG